MPTRNISLTKAQDAFIDEVLRTGEYRNASEAVRDAIRMLKARRTEESLRLDRLRVAIGQGIAALDRGEHVELGDDELDDYFDGLASPADR